VKPLYLANCVAKISKGFFPLAQNSYTNIVNIKDVMDITDLTVTKDITEGCLDIASTHATPMSHYDTTTQKLHPQILRPKNVDGRFVHPDRIEPLRLRKSRTYCPNGTLRPPVLLPAHTWRHQCCGTVPFCLGLVPKIFSSSGSYPKF
jgi:hypothetical protein